MNRSRQASPDDLRHIALMVYPHAQMSAVLGLTDVFAIADRLAHGGAHPRLRVSHIGPAAHTDAVAASFDTHPGRPGDPDVVILPPSLGNPPSGEAMPAVAAWLRARHAAGAVLASVCAGAFLLADLGVLDGRAATTHWTYAGPLAARFPKVRVDAEKMLIDDGDIITAGGLMAWTDLGLHLIERLQGTDMMIAAARFLVVDPPGREQRFYSAFSPPLDHGDEPVLKVQRWLQANGAQAVTVADMARIAGLEPRTFLRRFSVATGLRPVEYCQSLRIARARELLERTATSIDAVGWEVGYADPASFRKLFLRLTGLTPGDYRRRFGAPLVRVAE